MSITCVRDESDIVEAFVRHTATLVDEIIVLDNGSTDDTRRILDELRAEGLQLLILSDDSIGYWQWKRTSNLMRVAVRQCDADWVLPLDVDEFVVPTGATSLRAALRAKTEPVRVRWITYVPHPSDDPSDTNPCTRIRHRASDEELWYKVFVPRALAGREDAMLQQGSHDLEVSGIRRSAGDLEDVHLAHLPVRSAGQFAAKIAISQLQLLAMHERNAGWVFHQRRFYDLLKTDGSRFAEECPLAALEYTPYGGTDARPHAVYGPFPYAGGRLRHTGVSDGSRPLRAVLQYGEQLASAHANAIQQLRALEARNTDMAREIERLRDDSQTLQRALQRLEQRAIALDDEARQARTEWLRLRQARTGWQRAHGPCGICFAVE